MNKHDASGLRKRTAKGNADIVASDYDRFLSALKTRIQTARLSAARAVNRDLVLLYWDIGRSIVEKQKLLNWGDSVVKMVAEDLQKEFPAMAGFSQANIWRMRQFHMLYSSDAILAQAVRELKSRVPGQEAPSFLEQAVPEGTKAPTGSAESPNLAQVVRDLVAAVPWGHHVLLLGKTKSAPELLYYIRATARFGWSRNVLLNQIKAGAYERAVTERKTHNFPLALPEYLAEQAEEWMKSSYNLEFLGIRREIKERQLEDRLLERLREFILELGYGFCFVGRQHRLVLGRKEYFIDLLFYHRFIKALVAFDLKVGPFEPEYAGKMDFYLNLLNDKERAPDDHPSIGIILCAEKDNLEVEFALKSKTNPIGVAEYHLQSRLPPELKGKLPSARQLMDVVRPILPTKR